MLRCAAAPIDAALCVAETDPDDKEAGKEPAPLIRTASSGYLRLRREIYTDADLAAWAGRIRAQGSSEAYVFKHEDDGTAPLFAPGSTQRWLAHHSRSPPISDDVRPASASSQDQPMIGDVLAPALASHPMLSCAPLRTSSGVRSIGETLRSPA